MRRDRRDGRRATAATILVAVCAVVSSPASPVRSRDAGAAEPAPAPFPAGRSFAIRGATIHTVSGETISRGTLLVRDGKVAAVGRDVEVPEGIPAWDLPGRHVLPGLVDPETTLLGERDDVPGSLSPEVLAIDGWDFFADRKSILEGGVTTVYVAPGLPLVPGRPVRLISGRGCIVKLGGSDREPLARVLSGAAGVRVTLGESPKRPPGVYRPPLRPSPDAPYEVIETELPWSRPGEIVALRRLLDRTLEYRRALADWQGSGAPPPEPSREAAALLELVEGRDRLRVRANRARDILQALRLGEEYRIPVVVEAAREADRLASELVRLGVPAILDGGFRPGALPQGDLGQETIEGREREEAILTLARAGVKVALSSPTDAEVEDLLLQAEGAVRAGLDRELALRAVTLTPAEVLGVAERIGSLEPGKDADLVILGAAPFSAAARPQAVFIGGELVFHDGPTEPEADTLVIRCGRVLDGKGGDFPGGSVVVRGGKVVYAGPGALTGLASRTGRTIDAPGAVVAPGWIDAGTWAGARFESLGPAAQPGSGASGGGGRSTFRLADAVDPDDPELRTLLRSGITTILISPEPSGPISGQVSAWKLSGKPAAEAMFRPYAALAVRSDLRPDLLKRAKEYHEKWTAVEDKKAAEGTAPPRDEELEPLRDAISGKVPLVLHSPSAEALAAQASAFRKDFGVRIVGSGSERPDEAAEKLREAVSGALVSVPFLAADGRRTVNVPARCSAAGLRVAVRSGVGSGAGAVVAQVGHAVRNGWPAGDALRALTSVPAELFGIDDRVGALEAGRDADLVFLSGPPFDPATRVLGVMVEGEMRFETEELTMTSAVREGR